MDRQPKDTKADRIRITIDLVGKNQQEYLDDLRAKGNFNTRAELFRASLNVLDYVASGLEKGYKFLVDDGDKTKEIVFPFFVHKRQ